MFHTEFPALAGIFCGDKSCGCSAIAILFYLSLRTWSVNFFNIQQTLNQVQRDKNYETWHLIPHPRHTWRG